MKSFIDTQFKTVEQDGEQTQLPDLGGYETDNDVRYSVMDKGDGTCLIRVTSTENKISSIESLSNTTVKTDSEADTTLMAHQPRATLENLDQPDIEVQNELNQFTIDDLLDSGEKDQVAFVLTAHREIPREDLRLLLADHNAKNTRQAVLNMSPTEISNTVSEYSLTIPSNIEPATAARAVIQNPTVGNQVLQDQEVTGMNKVAKAKGLERASEVTKNTRDDNSGTMSDRAVRLLGGSGADHDDMLNYIKGNAAPPWGTNENPPAKGKPHQ